MFGLTEERWPVLRLVTMLFLLGLTLAGFVGSTPVPQDQEVRIVGGNSINITEAPYQIALLYRGRQICGGTIVAKDIVITAAHCVIGHPQSTGKAATVYLPGYKWGTGNPRYNHHSRVVITRTNAVEYQVRAGSASATEGGQVVPVGDLIWHPEFNYSDMDNDIAVLWLLNPLRVNPSVRPVKMLEVGEEIPDGDLTVVTGWGNTVEGGGFPPSLQKVLVPKVSEEICSSAYSSVYDISPRMLCAGVPEGGKDACQGDSGGPLVYNNKLAGVVSWGFGCARPDYPGVYSKVSALRSWVDDSISFVRLKHIVRYLRL